VAKGASNSGLIGAMPRTPEHGGGQVLLPVVLLLVALAAPRLVGAVTDAADGTSFTVHSFSCSRLGFVRFGCCWFPNSSTPCGFGSVPFRAPLRSCAQV
jgi:hypothetical protein